MFAQVHTPEQLAPNKFDDYLEEGWFRMGQTIFTTNFLHFKDEVYSAIWLRLHLEEFSGDSTQAKLFKQNAGFRTEIKKATVTPQKEELYARYREQLPFHPSESLRSLLYGKNDKTQSIYDTYEITVHDCDQLIAFGFFDIGATSASGITAVYDPVYKKFSLGKYLIYQKIKYCKDQKLCYFYPGYFVPGYRFFDYKLSIGKQAIQFLELRSQQWLPLVKFYPDNAPFKVMCDKLNFVQKILKQMKLECQVVKYKFFDANLIPDLKGAELFDFPILLYSPEYSQDSANPILVFDVRGGRYHLLRCIPAWTLSEPNPDPNFYSKYLLKVVQEIYSTIEAEEIAALLLKFLMPSTPVYVPAGKTAPK